MIIIKAAVRRDWGSPAIPPGTEQRSAATNLTLYCRKRGQSGFISNFVGDASLCKRTKPEQIYKCRRLVS